MRNFIFVLCLLPMITSCGGNLYNDISTKDSAAALLEDAKNLLDSQDYSTAITKLLEMKNSHSQEYLICNTEDGVRNCPREVLAGAYAGRCGFNFLTFVGSLGNSSGAVFKFLMNSFTDATVSPDDCYEAQKVIETIGTGTQLTSDQQIFMALLGMAKMGIYLRNDADTNQDGATDGTFDSCDSSKLSDAHVKQVITGLGLFLTYSAALSTGGSATSDLTDLSGICGAACSITDPSSSSLDSTVTDSFRDIIKSLQYGIESCDPLLPTCCP